MRLARVHLSHYGHFEDLSVTLQTRPGCINLVVAPNGAGKSVLRQAIAELLFGIHPRTPMDFMFGYPRIRLRAEAVTGEASWGFVRRKGEGNTVTGLDGRPADAALLGRLPRRDDQARLARLFMLDSAQLRAGGQALMQNDGDLADALLSGAGELGSARAVAARLAQSRDERAPVRKSATAPFHKGVEQWRDAGLRLRGDAVVRPAHVAALEQRRQDAIAARAAANADAAAASARLAQFARIRLTRPHLLALQEAARWLDANPDAPVLPAGASAALARARQQQEDAARAHVTLRDQHLDTQRDQAALGAADPILDLAAEIDQLAGERTAAGDARGDLPNVQEKLDANKRQCATLLRQLGLPADADAQDAIRPAHEITAARGLIQSAAQAALDAAAADVARLRQAVADAQDEPAPPPLERTHRLKAAHGLATGQGDPALILANAVQAVGQVRIAVDGAMARLPQWRGDASGLLALHAPAEAELTRLDDSRRAAAAALASAQDAHAGAGAELVALQRQLATLAAAGELPDAAAIAGARAHRDRGWRLVEARLAGHPGAEDEYDGGAPLGLAYPRAVAAADALADRRAAETERVAMAATLRQDIAAATAAQADAAQGLEAGTRADLAARDQWAACMASMTLPSEASHAEAQGFLRAREVVIAAVGLAEATAADRTRLQAQHAEWADALSEATGQPPGPLPALVAIAAMQIVEAEQAKTRHEIQGQALRKHQRALDAAERALFKAEAGQAAWQAEWDATLARLGRPAGEKPAVTSTVLDALVELSAVLATAADDQLRVHQMSTRLAQFDAAARSIASRVGLAGSDPSALADALAQRLAAARTVETSRTTLQQQADRRASDTRAAEAALARAQAVLDEAIAGAGGTDLPTALARVAAADERAAHETARAQALHRLHADGDGLDAATLAADAAAFPPETLTHHTQEATAAQDAAQDVAQQAAAEAQKFEDELTRLSTSHDAADAARERHAAGAAIGRVLEEALVQHAAATLLEHALALVEAESGTNAQLARIGAAFATLTGGAYARVSPAEDTAKNQSINKDHGRLQAHERDGSDKHIAQLSEGTRDQLYLALRLVAIEDHAAAATPLPFVADDILQTFDDTRALAALHALLALSSHAQVIVLTHHPHLAALATELPPGSVHRATLDGRGGCGLANA